MECKIPIQAYTGTINAVHLKNDKTTVTVGGETSYPFYTFEGEVPNTPKIAIQVPDYPPEDWPEASLKPYREVLKDPVAWAQKAQDEYNADIIFLWLKSTDPNGLNRSAEQAAEIAGKVLEAINIPLIVWGTANVEKDAEVLRQVAIVCADKKICLGPVEEANHKQIGAQALAYNHMVVASSPIDVNLAKQLNILLGNLGLSKDNILIDPTVGGLGYGIEYTYSVMERIRQAALTQQDDKLQQPMICNLAEEVWKTREAKLSDDPLMGKAENRGVLLEAITATTLLMAGADILVMRHPRAIQLVRDYIADMTGTVRPATISLGEEAKSSAQLPTEPAPVSSLPPGMRLDIDVAAIKDAPVMIDPDHMLALVKVSKGLEGITVSPRAVDTFSSFLEAKESAFKGAEKKEEGFAEKPPEVKAEEPQQPEIKKSWDVCEDKVGDFKYTTEKKKDFSGKDVDLISGSYEEGKPGEKGDWRKRFKNKEEMVQYLKTGLRYWYSKEGYGSEKRKKPA